MVIADTSGEALPAVSIPAARASVAHAAVTAVTVRMGRTRRGGTAIFGGRSIPASITSTAAIASAPSPAGRSTAACPPT